MSSFNKYKSIYKIYHYSTSKEMFLCFKPRNTKKDVNAILKVLDLNISDFEETPDISDFEITRVTLYF